MYKNKMKTMNKECEWTKDEDQILAGIVLQAKKEGKIQLEAFDEASRVLNCSAAVCGFRWNAVLRKKYI